MEWLKLNLGQLGLESSLLVNVPCYPPIPAKDLTVVFFMFRLNCPTDNLDSMVRCMKYERSAEEIIAKHHQYIVSSFTR